MLRWTRSRVVIFLLSLSGCGSASDPVTTDTPTYDLNQDGEDDIHYEPSDVEGTPGYYELRDRNFDGRIDESIFYTATSLAQYGRTDDDYDGYMDTTLEFRDGYLWRAFTDTNRNDLFDTAYIYRHRILKATRYYSADASQQPARDCPSTR